MEYEGVKLRDISDTGRRFTKDSPRPSRDISARGIYSGSRSEFGFVSLEGGGDDIFIPGGRTLGAIDGDFVEISYHKFKNSYGEEKTEGRVTKIIQEGRSTVIGMLDEDIMRHGRRMMRFLYVIPDDSKIMLRPRVRDSFSAKVGDKVEVI